MRPASDGAGERDAPEPLDAMEAALAPFGLILRGGFCFAAGERAPLMADGGAARAVLLVGSAGASWWPAFQSWRSRQGPELRDPLDTWSREVIGAVAERSGAQAVSPSDRPFRPFQRWAMRAEALRPSPLGILIHARYGLWHAYRGALLFGTEIGFRETAPRDHPCDTCREKPCLEACPVGAHRTQGFDHAACLAHLGEVAGEACRDGGCFSRNACPVGVEHRYPVTVQEFVMAAFATPPRGAVSTVAALGGEAT